MRVRVNGMSFERKLIGLGATVALGLGGAFVFVEKVDDGFVSVVSTTSEGATEVLDAGWHMVGLFDKTTEYPIRKTVVEGSVAVATSDNKRIDMPYTYEYRVDPEKVIDIFKAYGRKDIETVQESFLRTRIDKSIKQIVGNYNVLDIRGGKSSEASLEIAELATEDLSKEGFVIENVSLGIPEVDAKTQEAIDAQTQAEQQTQLKLTEQENAKIDAETAKIKAQATAEQKLIEAEANAEANRLLDKSITDNVLTNEWIKKWDGKQSLVNGDGGAILNIPNTVQSEDE